MTSAPHLMKNKSKKQQAAAVKLMETISPPSFVLSPSQARSIGLNGANWHCGDGYEQIAMERSALYY